MCFPMIKISTNEIVARPHKENVHIFKRFFRESQNFQRYHGQDNDYVHNY